MRDFSGWWAWTGPWQGHETLPFPESRNHSQYSISIVVDRPLGVVLIILSGRLPCLSQSFHIALHAITIRSGWLAPTTRL